MRKKDIKWSNLYLDNEDRKSLIQSFDNKDISGFSNLVKEFEEETKSFTECKYAIACSNGTAALWVAFEAIRIIKNKKLKIAVPTWSYIAPANAADYVGSLLLCDSEYKSHNIDPDKINKEADVICAVDMAGVPSNYKSLKKLNKIIISDAAESLGSKYEDLKIGSNALVTTTSFHTSKIITTGEGGMIFTNNKKINNICRLLINQGYGSGGYEKHDHIAKGLNFRMTGMQAAIGLSQIKKLPYLLEKRSENAELYNRNLKDFIELHDFNDNCKSSFYSYLILLKNKSQRNELIKFLTKKKVQTKLWKPIHLYKPYLNHQKKNFKVSEDIYNRHLRLPLNNLTSKADINYVSNLIKSFLKKYS